MDGYANVSTLLLVGEGQIDYLVLHGFLLEEVGDFLRDFDVFCGAVVCQECNLAWPEQVSDVTPYKLLLAA